MEAARGLLGALLRRGSVSLDEIGRRMVHTRGYMSRALRGPEPAHAGDDLRGVGRLQALSPPSTSRKWQRRSLPLWKPKTAGRRRRRSRRRCCGRSGGWAGRASTTTRRGQAPLPR